LSPDALAIDAAGTLFVANFGDGTVSRFAPDGSPLPPLTGLSMPRALLSDGHNLWVANQFSSAGAGGTVSEFDQNGNLVFTTEGLYSAWALAFVNGPDFFYTADLAGGQIGRFFPSASLFATSPAGGNSPRALAADANQHLFVANYGSGTVSVFSAFSNT